MNTYIYIFDIRMVHIPGIYSNPLEKMILFCLLVFCAERLFGLWRVEGLDVKVCDFGCFQQWCNTFISTDPVGMLEVA